ncbi:MAG: right-handed parallel beta-helix repeat-containing protein [Thermoplasmata archaeon]|nr:right-handed parallel beta-helix repeat-containing protein [Thermoplasmata archaeon]
MALTRPKTRVIVTIVVASIAVISLLLASLYYLRAEDDDSLVSETIRIYGDEQLATSRYVTEGDGTKDRPYVIEDLTITVSKDASPNSLDHYGMSISSTEAHLVIRNVTIAAEPSALITSYNEHRYIGVGLWHTSNVTILSCGFGPLSDGVKVHYLSTYLNISSNSFTHCLDGVDFDGDGHMQYGESITVWGNQFSACLYPIIVFTFANIHIQDNLIYDSEFGIWGSSADGIIIEGNEIDRANISCITLTATDGAYIGGNIIGPTSANQPSGIGISIHSSTSVSVTGNRISHRLIGVEVVSSSMSVHHNRFLANEIQAIVTPPSATSLWDDDVDEGNYWDDYDGLDADADGIGDTPYVIDGNNVDRYPLMS